MFNSCKITRAPVATLIVTYVILAALVQGGFSATAVTCPAITRNNSRPPTCCYPTVCEKDRQYRLCSVSVGVGYDSCEICKNGYINPVQVNTSLSNFSNYEYEMCYVPPCDCHPGSLLTNEIECMKDGASRKCECDLENGYWGDPDHCNLVNKRVGQPGKELTQTGQILPCKNGTYKSRADNSLCIPHTKCTDIEILQSHGTSTSDNVCVSVPNRTSNVENVTSKSPGNGTEHSNSDDMEVTIAIITSFIIPLCIVSLLGKTCYTWKYYYGKMSFISYIRLCVKQRTFAISLDDDVVNRSQDPFEPQNNIKGPNKAIDSDENQKSSTNIPESIPLLEDSVSDDPSDRRETGHDDGNSSDEQHRHMCQPHIDEVAEGDEPESRNHGASNAPQEHANDKKPMAKVAPHIREVENQEENCLVTTEQETGEPSTYVPYISRRFIDTRPLVIDTQEESEEQESRTSDDTQEKMVSSSSPG